jgi:hypothetical protein
LEVLEVGVTEMQDMRPVIKPPQRRVRRILVVVVVELGTLHLQRIQAQQAALAL